MPDRIRCPSCGTVKGREEKCWRCKTPGETERLKRLGIPWSKRAPSVPKPKLDTPVGWRYLNRVPRKGRKTIVPVYSTEVKLTRRLVRDCKLSAAIKRLVKEVHARIRRNYTASKREKRDPDERKPVGQVIGVVFRSFSFDVVVEVPKDCGDTPMFVDEGERDA